MPWNFKREICGQTRARTILPLRAKSTILYTMKSDAPPAVIEPEKLKPALHLKIDSMPENQLRLLYRVLLQIEAEGLAEHVGEGFDQDQTEGKLRRIPELVQQFRAEHRYR
jgi:hypothetical protein